KKERFFRGARIMKELAHDSIVKVLASKCSDEHFHFYVMEFIDGFDFREAVLAKKLSRDEILEVICRAGDALTYAHARVPNLIHRDVKPSNILLTSNKQAKVTDFDLVRAADTTGGTRTGSLGTFIYAAPESLDTANRVDTRADVFSLGMTALFGLHGRELGRLAFQQADKVVDSLDCSQRIKETLKKAVDWDESNRHSTMAEFVRSLRDAEGPINRTRVRNKAVQQNKAARERLKFNARDEFQFAKIATIELGVGDLWSSESQIDGHFMLSTTPVTQKQWNHVMGTAIESQKGIGRLVGVGANLPMYYVSWHDAVAFCERLKQIHPELLPEGFVFALPTSVQWQYACQAGLIYLGDLTSMLRENAWYRQNSAGKVHPVGKKRPNKLGLYDMQGNVWEWCRDEHPDSNWPQKGTRVCHGGGWDSIAEHCHHTVRGQGVAENRYYNVGFRVAAFRSGFRD
ncbi:MAG: bifunctional serine/threonine-protein kinase/formylglycine-generating enzyme family protein, partial [Planctomycetota bacterium]